MIEFKYNFVNTDCFLFKCSADTILLYIGQNNVALYNSNIQNHPGQGEIDKKVTL